MAEQHGLPGIRPAYRPGQSVRVKAIFPPGHVRTPFYCRGKSGTVERIVGPFRNPEKLAYGDKKAEPLMLYRVRFAQHHLWSDYAGSQHDFLELELYEPWLESISVATES